MIPCVACVYSCREIWVNIATAANLTATSQHWTSTAAGDRPLPRTTTLTMSGSIKAVLMLPEQRS